ncbi:hypothetical protein JCM33374_g3896 [Metschnikowia sp. JCM 33374]|nr:hypothetical protein JCM33374_g3896 [Metschnikowia sp. JCM 33374]
MSNKTPLETSPPEKLTGFEWWRRSLAYRTGLGVDEKEAAQFEHDYKVKYYPPDCDKCEKNRDWVLKYSPSVTFMMDHVGKLGGNLTRRNITCGACDEAKGGGFHPEMGILLCSNWLQDKYSIEDVLTHELVHAYDHLKFNVDLTNLRHHACTEIRASMLSGECRIMSEIQRTGLGNFGGKFQECVKRRAVLSVSANPKCQTKEEAEDVVNLVWKSCFNDTRPFERVYR